jgi:hypothetical protein
MEWNKSCIGGHLTRFVNKINTIASAVFLHKPSRIAIQQGEAEELVSGGDVLQDEITVASIEITRDTHPNGKLRISEVWRTVGEASSLTANHCHSPEEKTESGGESKEKRRAFCRR